MAKTPDYVVTADCKIYIQLLQDKVLPEGSFVRPIKYEYLPDHIKGSYIYDERDFVFCYTRYGIVLLSWKSIRRLE